MDADANEYQSDEADPHAVIRGVLAALFPPGVGCLKRRARASWVRMIALVWIMRHDDTADMSQCELAASIGITPASLSRAVRWINHTLGVRSPAQKPESFSASASRGQLSRAESNERSRGRSLLERHLEAVARSADDGLMSLLGSDCKASLSKFQRRAMLKRGFLDQHGRITRLARGRFKEISNQPSKRQ